MGNTLMGSQGKTSLLSPEQQQFFSGVFGGGGGGIGGQAGQAYQQFLQPQSQEDLQAGFQKGVVDPMMQIYEQQTVPALQQRFVDANASSSSAMNQALGQSAQDLTTSLGSQYLPYMQGQQQNTLQALNQVGGLAGQQTYQPYQQQGALPALLQGLGTAGAGSLAGGGTIGNAGANISSLMSKSSREVKENIRDYSKGLDIIKDLEVKNYDYIDGPENRVGLIAEHVPEEFIGILDGIKAVDVYGLVGLLINAVKELNSKVQLLEV